jgi:hypothetical protein
VKASLALEVSERVWFYLHPRMYFILNCKGSILVIFSAVDSFNEFEINVGEEMKGTRTNYHISVS